MSKNSFLKLNTLDNSLESREGEGSPWIYHPFLVDQKSKFVFPDLKEHSQVLDNFWQLRAL